MATLLDREKARQSLEKHSFPFAALMVIGLAVGSVGAILYSARNNISPQAVADGQPTAVLSDNQAEGVWIPKRDNTVDDKKPGVYAGKCVIIQPNRRDPWTIYEATREIYQFVVNGLVVVIDGVEMIEVGDEEWRKYGTDYEGPDRRYVYPGQRVCGYDN